MTANDDIDYTCLNVLEQQYTNDALIKEPRKNRNGGYNPTEIQGSVEWFNFTFTSS